MHRFKRLLENCNIDAKLIKSNNGIYNFPEEIFVAVLEEIDNKSSTLYKISSMRSEKLNADELFQVLVSYSRECELSTSDEIYTQLSRIIIFLKSIFIFYEPYLVKQIKNSIDLYAYSLSDCCTSLDKCLHLYDLQKLIDHEVIVNMTNMSLSVIEVADIIENYKKKTGDTACINLRDSVDENFKEMMTENNFMTYTDIVKEDKDFLDYFKKRFHKTPEEVFLYFKYK